MNGVGRLPAPAGPVLDRSPRGGKPMSRARFVWFSSSALVVGLLVGIAPARGSLINGDFSQGLTGWTADPAASVSVVSGMAVLSESDDPLVTEVDLFQDF